MSVILFLASKSDEAFAKPIEETLEEFDVPVGVVTLSAHKVPEKVVAAVQELNARKDPVVVITVVGMSNGLSGVVAASCIHPVIACPNFADRDDYLVNIHSTLQMPSEVPVLTILNPKNAALAAIRILAASDLKLRKKIEDRIATVKEGYR